MTTDMLKTFVVILRMKAECMSDVEELIQDYTGNETHVVIDKITKVIKESEMI